MKTDLEVCKQHILSEIRRTTKTNGGAPLGIAQFKQETGIQASEWRGKIWPRWGDAIREAGYEPNKLQAAYDDEYLLEKFIGLVRTLGRFPVALEVTMKARSDDGFPSKNTFGRFGSKQQLAAKLVEYCRAQVGYEDVAMLVEPLSKAQVREEITTAAVTLNPVEILKEGYVYLALLKLGREKRFKIGKAVLVERRRDQISLQLPGDLELVHVIATDDAYGIENYWHKRFEAKNTKGEWFSLSQPDIAAFKRRKFM